MMFNESRGIPVNAPCEPMERPQSLIERVERVNERLNNIFSLAESVYGELYGHAPSNCGEDVNKPRFSLEDLVIQIDRTTDELQDCLAEILKRLRG